MLVFESQTPQDLLKEIAEWLRMRALRANYVPAKTKKLREMDDAFHAALQTAAMELEQAEVSQIEKD